MTEERKYAILFAATLLCGRKLIETMESDKPNMAEGYFIDRAIQKVSLILKLADGAVSSRLRRQPVVAAVTAGEVASAANRAPLFDHDAPSVVNALGVAASARQFPLASRHTRMLSHVGKRLGRLPRPSLTKADIRHYLHQAMRPCLPAF